MVKIIDWRWGKERSPRDRIRGPPPGGSGPPAGTIARAEKVVIGPPVAIAAELVGAIARGPRRCCLDERVVARSGFETEVPSNPEAKLSSKKHECELINQQSGPKLKHSDGRRKSQSRPEGSSTTCR